MHILYLHQFFCPPGGKGNNRSYELSHFWVKNGHKVTVITSQAYFPNPLKDDYPQGFDCEGINVITVDADYDHMMTFPRRMWSFLMFYLKILRKPQGLPKVDLVYSSSPPLSVAFAGHRMAKKLHCPLIYETVDVWPDVPIGMGIIKNKWLIRFLNRKTKEVYEGASKVVCLSEGMAGQVTSHGVDPEKICIAHNGVDTEKIKFIERSFVEDIHVVYTGTVGIANGVEAVVKLAKSVDDRGLDRVRFTVLGNGNDLRRVKKLATAYGLNNLQFIDWIPKEEMSSFFKNAHIGLVTFRPNKVLEANSANKFFDYLASGLPVLINYQGWQAKYLTEFEAGLSSPMGDHSDLANNLIQMIESPDRLAAMSMNARRLAVTHFSRKDIAQSLLEEFAAII